MQQLMPIEPKRPKNPILVGCLGAASIPILFVAYIYGCLLCIQFWPLPSVPKLPLKYSVADSGVLSIGDFKQFTFDSHWDDFSYRIDKAGKVLTLTDQLLAQEKQKVIDRISNQGISNPYFSAIYSSSNDINLTGTSISTEPDGDSYGTATISTGDKSKDLPSVPSGYHRASHWIQWQINYTKLNDSGLAIATGAVATGFATSGGTSNPHGRNFGAIYGIDGPKLYDLNSIIDPASGWYIDGTIDINDSGQILCIGRKCSARDAEKEIGDGERLLVLTPITKH